MNKHSFSCFIVLILLMNIFTIRIKAQDEAREFPVIHDENIAQLLLLETYQIDYVTQLIWETEQSVIITSANGAILQNIGGERIIITDSIYPMGMTIDNNSSMIAMSSADGRVHVFDLNTMRIIDIYETEWQAVADIAFNQNDLIVLNYDSLLTKWDVNTGNTTYQAEVVLTIPPLLQAFFNDSGEFIVIIDTSMWVEPQTIDIWETATPSILHTLNIESYPVPQNEYTEYSIYEAVFSDDSTLFVLGRSDIGLINLWQLQSPYETYQFENPSSEFSEFAIHPDNTLLFIGNPGGQIHVLDIACIISEGTSYNDCLIYSWLAHEGGIISLDFNQSGTFLASAGFDNKVAIWAIDN